MYLRTMDIPMLDWIDDMLGMTLQQFPRAPDGEQFQAALTAMAVTSFVLFKAGYFLSLAKCSLIPEQFMTYLGIDCKTVNNSTLMEVNAGLKEMVYVD